MNIGKAEFIKSAASGRDFIRDGKPQVVFAGRSNVGKSSVINKLLGRRNFARVGKIPGKTVHINYFLIDKQMYIVDLPGYGYAKVSKAEKERWSRMMEGYFLEAELISMGVLIVDIRHKPTGDDVMMAEWFKGTGCPLITVANKLDKLKRSEVSGNMERIREVLGLGGERELIAYSAEKGDGREELEAAIMSGVVVGSGEEE